MSKTRTVCYLSVLTALYVVLSAFLKFYVGVGHIQVDLGYIAFSVALCEFGVYGAAVGVIGCALESMLFTAYGFSISWVVANAIIGVGCGIVFLEHKGWLVRIVSIVVFCAIGLVIAKTAIECALYSIPLAVKLPKSIAAFAVDSATMIAGLVLYERVKRYIKRR